jgi:hypothetical protein
MSDIADPQITLADLSVIWNEEDGLPIFTSDRDNICSIVENLGFQIYYLIGNNVEIKKETIKTLENGKQVTKTIDIENKNFQIFKVVNNFVGRCIRKVDIPLPDVCDISTLAHYKMPPIPHVIIDKLDQFFRLVDAQHGTESIVMLTYDTNKQGSEGWGILVPNQENTAAHCNYDPHSIAEIKPDNVMIVGSVHSHPNMAAYASGTDHADQADFDGIHITYGWQKSVNNGATQYHIEMQMSGQSYLLTPEDVFENYTLNKEPDPEVVEWSGKVKKELPLHTVEGYSISHTASQGATYLTNQASIPGTKAVPRWINILSSDESFDALALPKNYILFQEVPNDSKTNANCQVCGSYLDHFNICDNVCDICDVPLFLKETPKEKIVEELMYYCYQYGIHHTLPVYMIGLDDDKSTFVMLVDSLLAVNSYTYSFSQDNFLDIYDDSSKYLLCCGTSLENDVNCSCFTRIYPDDLDKFADFLATEDIYIYSDNEDSSCSTCLNYWEPSCPKILNEVTVFILDKRSLPSDFKDSITSDNCQHYIFDEQEFLAQQEYIYD